MLAGFVIAIANYVLYARGVIHYGSIMQMDSMGGTCGFRRECGRGLGGESGGCAQSPTAN